MTESQNPAPEYGVVSCGKFAPGPEPLAAELGPCRLEPGHAGKCRWPYLGGTVSVTERADLAEAEGLVAAMRRDRRRIRASFRVILVCLVINIGTAVYSLVHLFT